METSRTLKAVLITKGRKTGKEHAVILRAVLYNGKYYFSRHRPDGDWYKNAIANKEIKIKIADKTLSGIVKEIKDKILLEKISQLKYPDDERSKEPRVAIEVTIRE